MVLPLWVAVTKEGLQTRIVFHGEWVFTNHLPQEVQVRELYTDLWLTWFETRRLGLSR